LKALKGLGALKSMRVRFAAVHLLVSVGVALAAAALVFLLWYPAPLHRLAGGLTLFTLLAAVDVVLGPAMTLVVASPGKPRAELRRDLAVIAAVQLAGLLYGLHTIALARPAYLVFEVDRFQVVSAADFEPADLAAAPPALQRLPWTGPGLISTRRPKTQDEFLRSIEDALKGRDLARQPGYWQPLAAAAPQIAGAGRPVDGRLLATPPLRGRAEALAAKAGVALDRTRWLPVLGRDGEAVVLVTASGERVIGFLDTPPPP
jgi:hypothetical protein